MSERETLEQVYDTPMYDADGEPAAALDSEPDDAADAETLGATEGMIGDSPQASLDAADSPEPDRVIPPEVEAELRALRAQREQWDQQQRAQAKAQAEQYWAGAWNQIEQGYATEQQKIYAESEKAYDPSAFVRERMTALNAWKTQATQNYYQQREQAVWQFAAQQAIPGYANVVAQHYGLDADDTKRLMKFPPELMPQMAEELRAIRQDKRSFAAAQKAANNPAPGSGAGRAGKNINPKTGIKAGSRESASLLASLLR